MSTVVFILGNWKSGSTLLDMILGSHTQCTSLGEYMYVDKSMRPDGKDERIQREGLCRICGKGCPVWQSVQPRAPQWHKAAFDYFKTPYLIDSSKMVDWAKACIPISGANHKLVRLTRSGRDRFGSMRLRRNKVKPFEIAEWVEIEQQTTEYLAGKEHATIRYEDIAQGHGIPQLCDFIGVQYEPQMLEYWKPSHHIVRGNKRSATVVKLYHKRMSQSALSKREKAFVSQYGYGLKYIPKAHHMTDADMRHFEELGGMEIEKDLGYAV